jgi:phage terminase large subunit-like protein
MAGLEADEWQQFVIVNAMGERPDGKWAAFEIGLEVPRQNGKGGVDEIRELAGLFLLGEELIIHSAHEFSTAEEALERMVTILESSEELSRRVRTVKRSHGQEGIYLKNGQRLRYRTRTKGGGRGLSADLVVLDEAMHIPEAMLNALFPVLAARDNPQLWYTGSAVDQETMPNGVVFARLRERAIEGVDPGMAYFGWSPGIEHPDKLTEEQASDPAVWAQANPALGVRISEEYVAAERRSMSLRGFAVERLGVGDWPQGDDLGNRVIADDAWLSLIDRGSSMLDPVCFAFDVAPDRSMAAICAAGRRVDGRIHVEVIDHRAGTNWVAARVQELLGSHENDGVWCDTTGPAGSLLPAFAKLGIEHKPVTAHEHAKAAGMFFDATTAQGDGLRHLGTHELTAAVKGAKTRPLGDAWAWGRKSSAVDISPLVACTLAFWGVASGEAKYSAPLAAWA